MDRRNAKAWLYLLPAILFLGVFMVYPLIVASLNHQDVDVVEIVEIFQAIDSYLAHEQLIEIVGG